MARAALPYGTDRPQIGDRIEMRVVMKERGPAATDVRVVEYRP